MVAVVWECDVKPDQLDAFERLHGADGAWTTLSRRSRSFLGSSFLRDLSQPTRYLVVEYWSEMLVYEHHLTDVSAEIARLEAERQGMVERSHPLGIFTALDVPDRTGPAWSQRSGRA